jgi:hypothetical protein
MNERANWIAPIFYEEDTNGITRGFPFIEVPQDKDMPNCLFIYGMKTLDTKFDDEFEKEVVMYSYANMTVLKNKLPPTLFDEVRMALGLQPLHEATSVADKMLEDVVEGLKKEYELQKNVDKMINRINEINLSQEEDKNEN